MLWIASSYFGASQICFGPADDLRIPMGAAGSGLTSGGHANSVPWSQTFDQQKLDSLVP